MALRGKSQARLVGSENVRKMMKELPDKFKVSAQNAQLRNILRPYLKEIRQNAERYVSGRTTRIENINTAINLGVIRTNKIGIGLGAMKRDRNSYKLRFIERGFAGKVRISPKPIFRIAFDQAVRDVPKDINKDFEKTVGKVVKRHRLKLAKSR